MIDQGRSDSNNKRLNREYSTQLSHHGEKQQTNAKNCVPYLRFLSSKHLPTGCTSLVLTLVINCETIQISLTVEKRTRSNFFNSSPCSGVPRLASFGLGCWLLLRRRLLGHHKRPTTYPPISSNSIRTCRAPGLSSINHESCRHTFALSLLLHRPTERRHGPCPLNSTSNFSMNKTKTEH